MFLKQENPEMNDFEEENFVGAKMSQNIFAYSFVIEHWIFFYLRKKGIF